MLNLFGLIPIDEDKLDEPLLEPFDESEFDDLFDRLERGEKEDAEPEEQHIEGSG